MKFERIPYKGWENCYQLSNGVIDLVITGDVGPRIIRFGFMGQENEFCEMPWQIGQTGGDQWTIYGGHRLWHAPENKPRTYYPDNTPIEVTQQDNYIHVVQPTEPTTGIQKALKLYMDETAARLCVVHCLTNHNLWPVELAPWGLSVMAAGGQCVLPLPPRRPHKGNLQPSNVLILWPYTDLSDSRWTWGKKYILLQQEPGNTQAQKIGVSHSDGWIAYRRNGHLFVTTVDTYPQGTTYPDYNSNIEAFTNELMLEVETLGPLQMLDSGATIEHEENWYLFDDVPLLQHDADIEQHVLPIIQSIK